MIRKLCSVALVALVIAVPAAGAAQDAGVQSLEELAFMAGCWRSESDNGSALEEYYSTAASDVMLGASRFVLDGRTVQHEFSRITRDSAGIALLPFPNGRAAEYPFRLTSSGPGMALFEAPEHDFPKRIRYSLSPDGAMTARIDGGEGDARVQEWSMRQVDCHGGMSADASQSPGEPVPALVVPGIATHSVTAANGRVYQLYVHLPPGYGESDLTSYPVLYLTDAEMEVMAMYVGIANFLRFTQRIRDVILVGIADGDVGVHGNLRRLDYTPTRRPADSTTSGGADEFLDFVHAVAMPLIDDVYRTEASDRGLWGYSFGGALAAHALLNRPGMFQRYVLASPSVAWDDRLLVKQATAYAADNDAYASSDDAATTRIYTAYGTDELPANIEAWQAFMAALGMPAFSGLNLSSELVAGADHGTVMPIAFMRGLIALYATEPQ